MHQRILKAALYEKTWGGLLNQKSGTSCQELHGHGGYENSQTMEWNLLFSPLLDGIAKRLIVLHSWIFNWMQTKALPAWRIRKHQSMIRWLALRTPRWLPPGCKAMAAAVCRIDFRVDFFLCSFPGVAFSFVAWIVWLRDTGTGTWVGVDWLMEIIGSDLLRN
jgi:hypothetical protein